MALPSTNLALSAVRTYIGSTSYSVATLVGVSGLNKYSFYAPGELSVTGTSPNQSLVLTPPTTIFKLGDYRLYDKDVSGPAPPSSNTESTALAYGPTGLYVADFVRTWLARELNIKAISGVKENSYYYATMNFYKTEANRTDQVSVWHTQTFAINFSSITPLVGHTRNQSEQVVSAQICTVSSLPVATLTTPNHHLYAECFISQSDGTRVLNLGPARSDGYFDCWVHLRSEPKISGTSSQEILDLPPTNPPANFVHVFPRVSATNTTACSISDDLCAEGGAGYQFYLKAWGPRTSPTGNSVVAIQSCNVHITIKNLAGDTVHTEQLKTGIALGATTGDMYECYGTLTGYTWNYDDIGTITLSNVVFAATPDETAC